MLPWWVVPAGLAVVAVVVTLIILFVQDASPGSKDDKNVVVVIDTSLRAKIKAGDFSWTRLPSPPGIS